MKLFIKSSYYFFSLFSFLFFFHICVCGKVLFISDIGCYAITFLFDQPQTFVNVTNLSMMFSVFAGLFHFIFAVYSSIFALLFFISFFLLCVFVLIS